MLKVGDPFDFLEISEEKGAVFRGRAGRHVKLTVNAPYETRLYYRHKDAETGKETDYFLAVVKGMEVIEFLAHGDFMLGADARCGIRGYDGDDVALRYPADESFTKVTARRPINPDIARLEHQIRMAEERRLREHNYELARMRQQNAKIEAMLAKTQNIARDSTQQPEPSTGSGVDLRNDSNSGEGATSETGSDDAGTG